jgi:hypothetical protein
MNTENKQDSGLPTPALPTVGDIERMRARDGRLSSVERFESLGFILEATGGGCEWLRLQLNENVSMVVTDGEAGLPNLTAQLFVMVGEHSEVVAKGELMSTEQLVDALWKGGLGL